MSTEEEASLGRLTGQFSDVKRSLNFRNADIDTLAEALRVLGDALKSRRFDFAERILGDAFADNQYVNAKEVLDLIRGTNEVQARYKTLEQQMQRAGVL